MFTQLLRIPTGIHSATSLPRTQGHLLGTNHPSVGKPCGDFGILGSSEVTNWTRQKEHDWDDASMTPSGARHFLASSCLHNGYESPVI